MDLWSYPWKRWNSGPIFVHIRILILSMQIPISISIVILMWFFQTMEFWPQFYKDWNNNLILPNIRILALFLYTLEFWPNIEFWRCSYKHRGIPMLSFYCNHWNCRPSSFHTFKFWPYLCTQWNSYLILQNLGLLALFL